MHHIFFRAPTGPEPHGNYPGYPLLDGPGLQFLAALIPMIR